MEANRTNTLTIRTPEGIEFSLSVAGPVTRFLAWAVDVACVVVVLTTIGGLVALLEVISWDVARALGVWVGFAVSVGYGIVLEWFWRGQTIGKRLLRLRVMDVQGLRLHFSQVVVRNLLRVVDALPAFYMVGGVACILSRRGQRLGDLAANTAVVRTPQIAEPDLSQVVGGKYNSFREHPHLVARLRQRVSPREAGIALQALLRREKLDLAARIDLFRQIADHFRQTVQFPQQAVDGLSDEQYVRNVVDVLYRTRGET